MNTAAAAAIIMLFTAWPEQSRAEQPRIEATAELSFSSKADALPVPLRYGKIHIPIQGDRELLHYDMAEQQVIGVSSDDQTPAPRTQHFPPAKEIKELVSAALHSLPVEAIATPQGIFLRYSSTLETSWAADLDHWSVELAEGGGAGKLTGVSVGTDDRSVFLMIEGMTPGSQVRMGYQLRTAEGSTLAASFTGVVAAGNP
jgi:hypothetical protein